MYMFQIYLFCISLLDSSLSLNFLAEFYRLPVSQLSVFVVLVIEHGHALQPAGYPLHVVNRYFFKMNPYTLSPLGSADG